MGSGLKGRGSRYAGCVPVWKGIESRYAFVFRLRSPGACSLQAVLGKVTQTSYLLFAPFGGTQKYTAAFRAVSCTLCCLRFRALKGKPPSSAHPIARQQKHFGKKKNLPAFILLSARKSAAKERKSLRLSPYCPPAKAQRKKEKPPGLRPTSRQQKHFGKRKASRPLSYFLPEKALRKKKSLPAFILLIACKNVKRKQVRDLCDFAEPSLETIGSRRRRRSTNAYLFS